MNQTLEAALERFWRWYERLLETRWARWLLGPSGLTTGASTWRVTYHTRGWTDLCARIEEGICRRYPPENGFRIRADEFDAPGVALGQNALWSMRVYRGLTSGFIFGCWFTGQAPSGEEEVRLGVGRWSRLEDWTSGIAFFSTCLLTLAVVVCLFQSPLVHLVPGVLLLFLIIVTILLSLLVVGVAARFFLDPIVAAAGYLEGNRLSDREIDDVVELVHGVAEESRAVAVARDRW